MHMLRLIHFFPHSTPVSFADTPSSGGGITHRNYNSVIYLKGVFMYSTLVTHVNLSPNCTIPRDHPIDRITIHHVAGDATVEALGALFARESRQASSNYGIGSDGRIACFVEEENRPWTSGDRENDMRAITIEVANCGGEPDWPISDAAYAALLDLCEDICRRYDFRLDFTGDKSGNLTMHKWFQPTACPGPYLESRFPAIAAEVNRRLTPAEDTPDTFYRVQVGAFNNRENALAFLHKLQSAGFNGFIQTVKRT